MRGLRIAVWAAAGWTLLVGVLVLVGWALRWPSLTQLTPALTPMKPLTAALFAVAGAALLLLTPDQVGLLRHRAGQLLGLTVAVVSVVVFAEYATGRALAVDHLLFPLPCRRTCWPPGRPCTLRSRC